MYSKYSDKYWIFWYALNAIHTLFSFKNAEWNEWEKSGSIASEVYQLTGLTSFISKLCCSATLKLVLQTCLLCCGSHLGFIRSDTGHTLWVVAAESPLPSQFWLSFIHCKSPWSSQKRSMKSWSTNIILGARIWEQLSQAVSPMSCMRVGRGWLMSVTWRLECLPLAESYSS